MVPKLTNERTGDIIMRSASKSRRQSRATAQGGECGRNIISVNTAG